MRRLSAAACLMALVLPGPWPAAMGQTAGPPGDGAPGGRPFLPDVPLADLKATRDRPLFSPSRRPAPPAPARDLGPPVPPAAPAEEPLRLTLLGIIRTPEGTRSAVVMDETDHTSHSLKTGDIRKGWVVRSIDVDAVTVQKQERRIRLTFQRGAPAGLPFPATGLLPPPTGLPAPPIGLPAR